MPWTSHKLRSGKTNSKMAARRWRATLVPVGPQQAQMTSSLTKCGLWSCRSVVSPSENLRISTGSVHSVSTDDLAMRSVREIRAEAANDGAEATPQLIQTFLAKHNIPVIRQAPYSPEMAPCDFWLLLHLKTQLKGTRFESRDDITRNTTVKLYSIRKEAFQKCFEQWRNRWGEVCSVTRRLFRRGLWLQTTRHVNVFFPAKGRILFEHATYSTFVQTKSRPRLK